MVFACRVTPLQIQRWTITPVAKSVAELDSKMAEATGMRQKEKAENEVTIKDAQDAQTAVAQALVVLLGRVGAGLIDVVDGGARVVMTVATMLDGCCVACAVGRLLRRGDGHVLVSGRAVRVVSGSGGLH